MNDDDKKTTQPNTDIDTNEYQKILDEYAASVKPEEEESITADSDVNPELQDVDPIKLTTPDNIMITPNTGTFVPGSKPEITVPTEEEKLPPIENPIKETESVQPETTKSPEEIKAKIDEILADDSNNNTNTSSPTTKSVSFKNIFIISLLIFLLVAAGWFYFLFFYKSTSNSSLSSSVTPTSAITPTETISSEVCELNGETYSVGDAFKSADGCNTCTCQTGNTITCTEMACDITPTTTATKSATKTTVTPTKSVMVSPTTKILTPTKSASSSAKVTTLP